MPNRFLRVSFAFLLLFAGACGDDDAPGDGGADGGVDGGPNDPPAPAPFDALEQTGRFEIPGLTEHAHVVRTEMDVPHVYAKDRLDAFRVLGFVMARDRFFQMDMTKRLAQGRLSEVLGDAALATDIENRQIGGGFVTDLFEEGLSAEEAAEVDAFAAGINAYVAAVRARRLPPPKEFELAALLFGTRGGAGALMQDWTRRDVVATGATVLYSTSFEGGDVGRDRAFDGADALFAGAPDEALRRAGLQQDIMTRYAPPKPSSSAAGWGIDTTTMTSAAIVSARPRATGSRVLASLAPPRVERQALARLDRHLERIVARYHRDADEGYGSNSWAVAGSATADGSSILAGDGHLQLSVPALFWQFGLDTMLIGGAAESTRMLGATIPGLPLMGVGTNGRIAWTQTAFFADVTDWYEEQLVLGADGLPSATRFQGMDRPLTRVDEVFEVANIPALDSVGRTEMLPRWVTFDGRFITSIEGRTVTADEPLGAGEARVNLMGEWIVPSDRDGDGVVSAISFYYGPFDGGTLLRAFRKFGLASSVNDFRDAMRHFIGYGGAMTASDANGSIFHSAYHAVPCREYLPRDATTRVFVPGADPRRLIDGTQYGAWSIPLDAEGRVDETAAAGDRCAVPFDQWPQALNPARQYVHHANNDPGNITTDGDLFDDPYYIGGPWIEGYRGWRIEQRLQAAIAGGDATIEEMAAIQGDHHSNLGEEWVPFLLETIAAARAAAAGMPAAGTPEARMAAAFTAERAAIEEIESRMTAWRDAGYPTPSGVETFYHVPAAGDAAHSVATTIFAAWFPRFVKGVLDDEGIPSALAPGATGDTYRLRTIQLLVRGRGAGNPEMLGSWEPTREESVFFDDVTTSDIESSDEIALRAVTAALAFLRGAPASPGVGGFGTNDMSAWLWGLRHQVKFTSLLGDYLGDDPSLALLGDMFRIDTALLPLADPLPPEDPRAGIEWFPRPGDQFDIDAANPGLGGESFTHGSGPVFRMVVALGPSGVRGQNILPGGQSGIPGSPHFADQVQLWLANETLPMRYLPEEVAAGAVSRERFVPAAVAP